MIQLAKYVACGNCIYFDKGNDLNGVCRRNPSPVPQLIVSWCGDGNFWTGRFNSAGNPELRSLNVVDR